MKVIKIIKSCNGDSIDLFSLFKDQVGNGHCNFFVNEDTLRKLRKLVTLYTINNNNDLKYVYIGFNDSFDVRIFNIQPINEFIVCTNGELSNIYRILKITKIMRNIKYPTERQKRIL